MKNFLLLILFFTSCTIFDDDNESAPSQIEGTLDIVSWNIQNFPKNELTIEFLSPIIDSLNIDIIALQEIESTNEFNSLISELGNEWSGYRADNSSYGELSYLINNTDITILSAPYKILNNQSYYFAYREPYVLEFIYNNEEYILINVHYKCCDGYEDRRLQASVLLKDYIDTNLFDSRVIILGDFNDNLIDDNNVFTPFLNDSQNFYFTDYVIAEGTSYYWSYPTYPSHIDHILITDELFNYNYTSEVLLIDQWNFGGFNSYLTFISDHRPIAIKLDINP